MSDVHTKLRLRNILKTTSSPFSERRSSIGGTPTPATRVPSLRDSGLGLSQKRTEKENGGGESVSDSRPVESSDASSKDTGLPVETSNGSLESAD